MTAARPDTWMPLYIGDYLRKTMHLTAEQHGAYMLLIMACWCNGGVVPNDDAQLAAIVRMQPARWRSIRPVMQPFFIVTVEGWRNSRVDEELANAITITNERSIAGKQGAAARWSHRQNDGNRIAEPLANASQIDAPSPSPSPEERKIPPKAPRKRGESDSEEFSLFWKAYPNKVGKPAARRAFLAAATRADLATILAGLERYKRDKPPDRNWLNPSTFLNQDRWADEPAKVNGHADVSEPRGPQGPAPPPPDGWLEPGEGLH